MKKKILCLLFVCLNCSILVKSQAVSFIDAGQAFLKLHLEINDQLLTRVNNYKVSGTQYLFGKQVNGNVYTETETGLNVQLSYNTHNQTLEIPSGNGFLVKAATEVDSFTFVKDDKTFFKENFSFLSSKKFGDKNPFFLLKLYVGNKYCLFKRYYTELGFVSTNYIQNDLRQFDLKFEYYYVDLTSLEKKLLKLKTNKSTLKKTLAFSNDCIALINTDDFDSNNENTLKKLFELTNQ